MAHTVRKMDYCYLTIASRAGQGGKILKILKEAGVNLLALSTPSAAKLSGIWRSIGQPSVVEILMCIL